MAFIAPALPFIGLGTSVLGTGMQVFGQIRAGKEEELQYKQQAAIMKTQAAVSQLEQTQASLQSAYEERKFQEEKSLLRERIRNLVSKQRAGYAASGAMLSGTPQTVMSESLVNAERDISMLEIEKNARRLGLNVSSILKGSESSIYRTTAGSYRQAGRSALTSGYIGAGSSMLQGVGSGIERYLALKGK